MNRRLGIALAILLVLIGGVLLRGDQDERAIRKAFHQLTEAAQWQNREDTLRAGLAARRVVGHCTRDIVFQFRDVPYRFTNRGELQTAIIHARTAADLLAIDVTDAELEVAPSRTEAEMFVTARITVRYARQSSSDLRSVRMLWQKTEDGWKVAEVRSFDTIDDR